MYASIVLLLVIAGLAFYGKMQIGKLEKKVKFADFKNRELQKKLKMALDSIVKMETNPDLVHSREFNLDYLRMRMDDDQFNFSIINQIKIRVKDLISVALRPVQGAEGNVGVASTQGRHVDETFDITYTTGVGAAKKKRVLFRIQIKLMRLPTQSTSQTIKQIIDCLDTFLGHDSEKKPPTIQGRLARIHWDQKAKPTPLLVLEQSAEGSNVTLRNRRS